LLQCSPVVKCTPFLLANVAIIHTPLNAAILAPALELVTVPAMTARSGHARKFKMCHYPFSAIHVTPPTLPATLPAMTSKLTLLILCARIGYNP
jgi:hypothetical protein